MLNSGEKIAMTFKATLTSKGQLTLPKAIRDHLRLHEGDHVLLDLQGDRVEMRVSAKLSIDQIFNSLPVNDQPALEEHQISELYGQHRLERGSSAKQ
jgi:AbrB family looped-hinge helix DNA binding protein